jgi:predicted RNA-binding protein
MIHKSIVKVNIFSFLIDIEFPLGVDCGPMKQKKRPDVAIRVLIDREDFKALDRVAKKKYRGKWSTAFREIGMPAVREVDRKLVKESGYRL